jgi:hypothetical protein
VQQHLAVGDVLPAMQLALLLATLCDDQSCLPGELAEGSDLPTMEWLLEPDELGYQPPELLQAVPELTRMLNTSAAMIQCGWWLGWWLGQLADCAAAAAAALQQGTEEIGLAEQAVVSALRLALHHKSLRASHGL